METVAKQIVSNIRQGDAPTEQPDSGYIDGRMREWLEKQIGEDEVSLF
ncbi:MAG: hypothetical protein J5486_01665 [Bacteroidaceae bacterium]|nr:hypothetical protein [Bacteroidaceae bacterium]